MAWGDGSVSTVPPHGLYVASDPDHGHAEDGEDSLLDENDPAADGGSEASWETVSAGGRSSSGGDGGGETGEGRAGMDTARRRSGVEGSAGSTTP